MRDKNKFTFIAETVIARPLLRWTVLFQSSGQSLVASINANDSGANWDYVIPSAIPLGSDEIAVGLIYDTNAVSLKVIPPYYTDACVQGASYTLAFEQTIALRYQKALSRRAKNTSFSMLERSFFLLRLSDACLEKQ